MAALDLFIRPQTNDVHPLSRAVLLALDAAQRASRLEEQQEAIRSRLAATSASEWHDQVGMIVAEFRRAGHALQRDGDTHTWMGKAGLAVSFCKSGNTVIGWQDQ